MLNCDTLFRGMMLAIADGIDEMPEDSRQAD
jgi:hypothetical protein